MTALHALPQDRALPHLARALDEQAMAEVFADELRVHGTQLESCSIERIKYRPNRNCTLSYLLRLSDGAAGPVMEQRVTARLCSGGDSVRRVARASAASLQPSLAGPALRLLPTLDMLTWWWPNDAKLTAPHVLGNARVLREQVLPELVEVLSDGSGTLINHEIEIVQYVPEQRLTARVDLCWQAGGQRTLQRVYAKASREPDGATAHAILRTLQASPAWRAGHLRTPRALLWQPDFELHWQEGLPGQALLDLPAPQAAALAEQLGAQLAALHSIPVPVARTLTSDSLRERLVYVTSILGDALPGAQGDLQRAAVQLDHGMHWLAGAPAATLHGDLHPRNVLADGGQLAIIDLDGLHRGPAVLELGAWVADGIYRALLDGAAPMRDAPAWQALLEGYARGGGTLPASSVLAWAVAWNLLTQRAWRCVVNLKPGRFAIAPRLIELAAAVAGARSLKGM
jgi:aminoglycoside phosphotransferase (APT) family kinase protein